MFLLGFTETLRKCVCCLHPRRACQFERAKCFATSTAKQETRPNIVPITVLESGEVLFDKDTVSSQKLGEKVHAAISADKDVIFVLRGDKFARYESVVAVLDLLKKSGASRVSIATEIKKCAARFGQDS
ncbi:MAG: biopolymer transporter ExbD [Selenomonadaceae bacterium]|nr:biopolymer transporter ExbD [Selenomonadaceae bacterium]